MSDSVQPNSDIGARLSGMAARVGTALQGGWREAAVPAAQAYLVTVVLAFLTVGVAGLMTADDLSRESVLLALKVALAAVAMAFRGALVVDGDGPDDLMLGDELTVVAPPLMLAAVAGLALAVCSRRRRTGPVTAPEAARTAACFAAMVGAGALLVRTTRDLFSLGDLTVRVALPGALFWAAVVAFAVVWLSAPGRARRLATELGGERLAPWRTPLLAGFATVGAVFVAAMVGGGLYGTFKVLVDDGLAGDERLGVLLVGFTYLPVIGAFAAGIAGGANLVGPSELGYDRLVLGWFGQTQPRLWWLLATIALLAVAVAGALWLVQRRPAQGSPWRVGFVSAFAAGWIALALMSQFILRSGGGSTMSFGLGTLGAIGTGIAIPTLATFAAERFRRPPMGAQPIEEPNKA